LIPAMPRAVYERTVREFRVFYVIWLATFAHAWLRPGRTRVILFRGGGAVLLAGSLALALLRDGPGFGSLLWATAISIAALGVALTLAWRPGVLRPLVAVARCF